MQVSQFEHHISCKPSQLKYLTKNNAFPRARDKHASCVHENYVYLLAGKDGNSPQRDFWRLNLGTLKWEKLCYRGDTPSFLEGHTLVSYKKLLLLFGGEFGDSLTGSSLCVINPDLGYIRSISPDPGSEQPSVRRHHSSVVYAGAMYVYGGYVDVKGTSPELWCYQIEDEEWEMVTPRQSVGDTPGGRYGHSAVVYNHHMWLYGGMTDLVPKQDLWAYSFGAQRWERIKNKYGPPQLTGHSAAVVGSNMILFGGTTNREAVNQLWCFCFESLKWTQLYLDDTGLSGRTFHSAEVIIPSSQENSVKASSMPYLQKKISQLHIDKPLPRPRSSPAQRSQSREALYESESQRRIQYERSNSAQVIGGKIDPNDPIVPKWDSLAKHKTQVLNISNEGSSESLKVFPSPAENAMDVSPLVPKRTDFNFNTVEMLNRNIVNSGIDNPGISNSTEELINESRRKKYSEIPVEHLGETGVGHIQSVNGDYVVGDCLVRENYRTCAKRTRLDPELVLEDIENSDCFPYKVQLPNPKSNCSMFNRFSSTDSISCDIEGIETIELEDVRGRGRSYSENGIYRTHTESFIDNHESMNSSGIADPCSQATCDKLQGGRRSSNIHEKRTVPESVELQPMSPGQDGDRNNRMYIKRSQKQKKSAIGEPPYMLVLGGKDKQKTNFSVKPIPIWKFVFTST